MPSSTAHRIGRRRFLRTLGGGVASVAFPAPIGPLFGHHRPNPNLLIIHTDQQSAWTISATPRLPGEPQIIETPNIDSIAANGIRLNNFFANSAMCTPSRACLMTGRYPNSTQTWMNDYPLRDDEITLALALRHAGYESAYIGKWHLSGAASPGWGNPDWEEPDLNVHGIEDPTYLWNCSHFKTIIEDPTGVNPPTISWQIGDEETYPTDFCARKAVDFIKRPHERPFFLMVGFTDPHQPYGCREPYPSLYPPGDMFVPPTIGSEDPQLCRERRSQYCAMVNNIDDRVGDILDALQEHGHHDNTIVVFTADHGDFMGEHGMYYKDQLYETVYRVPFLVQWPGRIPAGSVSDRVVSTVDVHPTLLALLGIPANARIEGRNAAHILLDTTGAWEDVAYEYQVDRLFAGIFTPEYHLFVSDLEYHLPGVPARALFDRANDPWETQNLYHQPAYRAVRQQLLGRLLDHHLELNTYELHWLLPCYGPASAVDRETAPTQETADRVRAHPNPFRGSTRIVCSLRAASDVRVSILDVDGRLIRRLQSGRLAPGAHQFEWDGRDRRGRPVGVGRYYCELTTRYGRTAQTLVRIP